MTKKQRDLPLIKKIFDENIPNLEDYWDIEFPLLDINWNQIDTIYYFENLWDYFMDYLTSANSIAKDNLKSFPDYLQKKTYYEIHYDTSTEDNAWREVLIKAEDRYQSDPNPLGIYYYGCKLCDLVFEIRINDNEYRIRYEDLVNHIKNLIENNKERFEKMDFSEDWLDSEIDIKRLKKLVKEAEDLYRKVPWILVEKESFELPTEKWDMVIPENSPLNYEVETAFYSSCHVKSNHFYIIFVWKWWSIDWYQNKYMRIAYNLVANRGDQVIVIENPWISRDDPELYFDSAMKYVKDRIDKMDMDAVLRFHVMWFSAWGHFVWRFAYKYPEIQNILLVNPVLRVDFEKLKKWMLEFKWDITIVQGNKDTDFGFNPLLDQIPNAKVEVLEWVDHQFTWEDWVEKFVDLYKKL